jgi:hypothetical protein
MIEQKLSDIVTPELESGAIYNEEFTGFREDYLVLHCLIKKYLPKSLMEIGTNTGVGTNIICNANPAMDVYSLDLPPELAHISLQSPESEGKGNHRIGSNCIFPFTQLFGNSLEYDYSKLYPIEAFYIDGEHCYKNVIHESREAIKAKSMLIIWHDSDIKEVYNAIAEAFKENKKYELFRVTDTRIAYAVRECERY